MRAFLLLALFTCAQGAKIPIPSEEDQKKAEKTIREVFKDEYAVKSPAAQQKLARKLVDQALESKDDDAARYVLFREAADLAVRSGEIDALLRSIDELNTRFEGVGPSFKESVLGKAEPNLTKPEDLKRLADVLIRLVGEALEQDQFDVAVRAAQSSQTAAKKAKDVSATSRADAAVKVVAETKVAFEKARKAEEALAAAPDDPAANQTWGEWLCFQKGRWDRGLGFLTKGPNSPVKALAAKEFSASPELESLIEVADGWWDLAEREKQPLRKSQLLAHARSIYAGLLPKSTGLVRAKIGKRLEFDKDAPAKEAKPAGFSPIGAWTKQDTGTVFYFKAGGVLDVPKSKDPKYLSGKWDVVRDKVVLTYSDLRIELQVVDNDFLSGSPESWKLKRNK